MNEMLSKIHNVVNVDIDSVDAGLGDFDKRGKFRSDNSLYMKMFSF